MDWARIRSTRVQGGREVQRCQQARLTLLPRQEAEGTHPASGVETEQMQAQIRIYTINKGELDNFIKHFKEETKPIHDKVGWPIVASWVNRPQNEFIWIRTYEDASDLEAKSQAFRQEVEVAGITLGTSVAKMEVREVEMA